MAKRSAIEGFLRARFGAIDQELIGVIPRLMNLESDEYTRLLLNLSRSRGVSEAIGAEQFLYKFLLYPLLDALLGKFCKPKFNKCFKIFNSKLIRIIQ